MVLLGLELCLFFFFLWASLLLTKPSLFQAALPLATLIYSSFPNDIMKLLGDLSDHSSPEIQTGHFAFNAIAFSVGTSWVEVVNLSLFPNMAILKTNVCPYVGLKALS